MRFDGGWVAPSPLTNSTEIGRVLRPSIRHLAFGQGMVIERTANDFQPTISNDFAIANDFAIRAFWSGIFHESSVRTAPLAVQLRSWKG